MCSCPQLFIKENILVVMSLLLFQIDSVRGRKTRMSGRSSRQEPDLPLPHDLHAEVPLPAGRGS